MPIEPARLMTASLETVSQGDQIAGVLAAALQAVDPGEAVRRFVRRSEDELWVDGRIYPLKRYRRVLVAGAGKAGAPMAGALAGILGSYLSEGQVIVKDGYSGAEADSPAEFGRIQIAQARHPLPDRRGVAATRRIVELVQSASPDDLVVCLLSGGGSALLTSPAGEIALEDIQALTSRLLGSGATINEINTLRKHLDDVKGGKLARLAAPASLIALILSDVVGDPLDVIASGPTVPDPSTFADAVRILDQYQLQKDIPASIEAYLSQGARGIAPETPKEGDPAFRTVQNVIVGNNLLAAAAAREAARQAGFHTLLLTTFLQGEARQAGRLLAAIGRQIDLDGQPLPRPACLIGGGETTVTLAGDGLGGRNQELALGAVADLAGLKEMILVTLATDGGDGPTDAAGAVVTGETFSRAAALGLRPHEFLSRNDAYHFFAPLGDLLRPGPTQTNVNDLNFLFAL